MKYYISERQTEFYTASGKARQDIEKILDDVGYKSIELNLKDAYIRKRYRRFMQLPVCYRNNKIIYKELEKKEDNDIVVFQYPMLFANKSITKVLKKYSKKLRLIAVIHDLDSLRCSVEEKGKMFCSRLKREDKEILSHFDYVIAHNEKMKKELIKLGIEADKIIILQLFDYIYGEEISKKGENDRTVIIAGNLSVNKARYLMFLNEIENVKFNLYGKGYDDTKKYKNINYKGAFNSDEIIYNLEGGFGLVWDGTKKETCDGTMGNYMRYNNPHKVSMYLAAKIPIIIWEEAALADFIKENNLGYTIKSLDDLEELLEGVTKEEYENILKNVEVISKKLKDGQYIKEALKMIELK